MTVMLSVLFLEDMMANYYDEILDEIESLMNEGKASEAMAAVKKELAMPYIPPETETKLKKLKRDLQYQISEKSGNTEVSLDVVLEHLEGSPEEQLASAAALSKRNLRDCLPEIQAWLQKDPFPQAGALIVEAIAEQEIGEEFVWNRGGTEYTFLGDGLTPVSESGGFLKAEKLLEEWLSNDHPDLFEMAKTLLVHEVYMFLPLSYEEEEGQELALQMVKQVSEMMDDGEIYKEVVHQIDKNERMN